MLLPLVFLAIFWSRAQSPFANAAPSLPQSNISEPTKGLHEVANGINRKWISQIMADELPNFIPHSTTNQECNRQAKLFKDHLTNLTLWAVQLYDASVFSEVGLLNGNEYTVGHYDQCVAVNVPEFKITGQYCNALMKVSPDYFNTSALQNYFDYKSLSPFNSVWSKIQKVNDPRIKYRDQFYWGICIPSGCNRFDLEESLNALLVPAFKKNNISAEIIVDDASCLVAYNSWNISTGGYVYFILVAGLILLVLIATFTEACSTDSKTDEAQKESSSVFLSFSAINNTTLLLKPETTSELRTLAGMKVISMFCVIFGHRMLMSQYWPLFNAEYGEEMMASPSGVFSMNGPIIVNTFLFATGFLVYNKIMVDIQKGRSINIPLYIFYRWIRIVPLYLFIICAMIFVKPLINNQPLYKREGAWRTEACAQNWWTHILFINNYYNADTECILPAWYLAVDMQLYVVAVITGYIMSKSKKTGYIILGFLFATSELLPAIITYVKNYDPILKLYMNFLDNYYKDNEYINFYIPTHMRAAPYIIGMLTAVILMKLKKKECSFSKFQRIMATFLCTILSLGSLCYGYTFFDPKRDPSLLEKSLYVCLHRFGWSAAMAWITISTAFHSHSKITCVLRQNVLNPFNKLMLHALLLHTLIQSELILEQRHPQFTNFFITVWAASGDIMVSYACSYILYLVISAPIARLQDIGLKKLLRKKN